MKEGEEAREEDIIKMESGLCWILQRTCFAKKRNTPCLHMQYIKQPQNIWQFVNMFKDDNFQCSSVLYGLE